MIKTEEGFLRIVSHGEIDPLAFTLMGGTTKRGDDSKIGMFGSGLKYSISSLIRNNIDFIVYSGENKLKFETKTKRFRSEVFEVIYINGKETSLTTKMGGHDWDKPFAPLREIYSNALDEDDESRMELVSHDMNGFPGFTTFYIKATHEVRDFFRNKQKYFLQGNPDVLSSTKEGSIYTNRTESVRVFRKGILSYESTNSNSNWMYNSDHFEINESRVISSSWEMRRIIAGIWKSCEDYNTVAMFLLHMSGGNFGSFERSNLDFDNFGFHFPETGRPKYSHAWARHVAEKKFVAFEHMDMFDAEELRGRVTLKLDMLKDLLNQFPDMDILGVTNEDSGNSVFANIVKNPKQELVDKVIDALAILNKTPYKERLDNPKIEYVKFSKRSILGRAYRGKIQLSVKLVDQDVSFIARVLIEENEHILTDFEDETRHFQDHLFQLYYNQLIRNS